MPEIPAPPPTAPMGAAQDPLWTALRSISLSLRTRMAAGTLGDASAEASALEALADDVQAARWGTTVNPTMFVQVAFPMREVVWPLPRTRALRLLDRATDVMRARADGVPASGDTRVYRTSDTRSEEGGGSLGGSVFDLSEVVGVSVVMPPGSPFYRG